MERLEEDSGVTEINDPLIPLCPPLDFPDHDCPLLCPFSFPPLETSCSSSTHSQVLFNFFYRRI